MRCDHGGVVEAGEEAVDAGEEAVAPGLDLTSWIYISL